MKKAWIVEVGVLLPEDDGEYGAYSKVYDGKHAYYDEDRYYCPDREGAAADAWKYAAGGVEGTYGVVSETWVDDSIDWNDCPVKGESYSPHDVVYSALRTGNGVETGFVETD